MRISVITVVYNGSLFIEDCIRSVVSQDYTDLEYIVVDGGSTDGTVDVIRRYESGISKWISEPDGGVYDGMNKGIGLATGDVIGFLNSDDVYQNNEVISRVAGVFNNGEPESCYGDLVYVRRDDLNKVVRRWKSRDFRGGRFKKGWHPPHPTFFVRKDILNKYGGFSLKYRYAADYELMLRLLERYRISTRYIENVLVRMRVGGASNRSLANIFRANIECYNAWKDNDMRISPWIIVGKPASKIGQYFF